MILVLQKFGRALAILATAFVLAFAIAQGVRRTTWFKDRLYHELLTGTEDQRLRAASILADVGAEAQLLQGLKSRDEKVSEMARRGLDHLWFSAAGRRAYARMEEAYALAEDKKFDEAVEILDGVLAEHPKYAEALNRRAAALWQLGEYEKARRDCEQALALNPNHYGAWQGLGVSQLQLGDFAGARRSLESALEIAPNDPVSRRCLKKVDDFLREIPGGSFDRPKLREADLL